MSRLATSIALTYVVRIGQAVVGLVTFPLITDHLGLSAYGLYLFLGAFGGLVATADLGLGGSLTREIAAAKAREDDDALTTIASTGLMTLAGQGLLMSAVLALVFALSWGTMPIPDGLESTAVQVAALAVLSMALSVGLGFGATLLVGLGRGDLAAVLGIIPLVGRVVGIAGIIVLDGGLVALALVELTIMVVSTASFWVVVRRLHPEVRIVPRRWSGRLVRSLLTYGSKVFFLGVSAVLILRIDTMVVGFAAGAAAVTLYAGATKVYFFIRGFMGSAFGLLIPSGSAAAERGDRAALRLTYLRGTRELMALTFAISVPAVVLAPDILEVWLGEEFLAGTTVMRVVLVALWLSNLSLVTVGLLTGMGRAGTCARLHGLWALGNVVLALTLVGPLGVDGVALALLLPLLIVTPLYTRVAAQTFDVPPRRLMTDVLRPTVLPAAVVGGLALAVLLQPHRPIIGLLAALGLSGLYVALYVGVAIPAHDRRQVMGALRVRAARLRPRPVTG